jgi:hypothetical protein
MAARYIHGQTNKRAGAEETMTPQERKLVEDLFERLSTLEDAPRDDGAVDAINAGLDRAPNALYPLVQTVLVQDEALKRADARIRELEAELGVEQPQAKSQGSFLDNMRDALLGREEEQQPPRRGSVPPVRPGASNAWGPAYGQGAAPMQPSQQGYGQGSYGQPGVPQGAGQPPQQQSGGGSFLGTAAATVAGVVGGAMLMNSMKGMFGGEKGQSHSAFDQPSGGGGAPWGPGASNSDLAKQAGLDDIGRGNRTAAYDEPATERTGLFGSSPEDAGHNGADGSEGDYDGGFDADFDVDP